MKIPLTAIAITITISMASLWAADSVVPLSVKEGLWEVTSTRSMTGMTVPNIPPETLAKLPPEQRAKIEAMMKGTPTTEVTKDCVTKEKLEKQWAFNPDRDKDCTHTVISSNSHHLEMKIHCTTSTKDHMTTDGTFVIDATGFESAKGSMHAVSSGNGRNLNIDFSFSSRYLGPSCGDVQ